MQSAASNIHTEIISQKKDDAFIFDKIYHISPIYRVRLYQLLNKFIYDMNKAEIKSIYNLIMSHHSDKFIVEYIMSKKENPKEKITMDSKKRGSKFALIWKKNLESVQKQFDITTVTQYLDIGSNNGAITIEFGKLLGLDSDNIYGIDIDIFSVQKIVPLSGFIFKEYDGYNIPYADKYFDLITCSMVLHHVKYPNILLTDIRRVLKDNGIIMIKEHNAYSNQLQWLIKMEHMLYDIVEQQISYDVFEKYYYQKLYTKKEIKKLFNEYGFEKIKMSKLAYQRYYQYNPTKHYYYFFVKKQL